MQSVLVSFSLFCFKFVYDGFGVGHMQFLNFIRKIAKY